MNDSAFARIPLLFRKSSDSEHALKMSTRAQRKIGNILMFFLSPFSVQSNQENNVLVTRRGGAASGGASLLAKRT
jgi:hypothetical protein